MDPQMPPDDNPYRSPEHAAEYAAKYQWNSEIDLSIVQRYRNQMHTLGAVWLGSGVLLALVCGLFLVTGFRRLSYLEIGVAIFYGLPLILLGAAVFAKQMWAVWIGLILTYIATLTSVFSCNAYATVLFLILVVQGHRALAMAGQLTSAGIPLDLRPQDYEA
jgi:hypothetical protein